MANEIEMSARLYAAKDGASINPQTWTALVNMTGRDMGQQTQEVSAAGELLDVTADLSLPYKLLVYNMSLVDECGIGDVASHVGVYWMRIPPRQFILIPYTNTNMYVKCMTAGSTLQIFAQYCEI